MTTITTAELLAAFNLIGQAEQAIKAKMIEAKIPSVYVIKSYSLDDHVEVRLSSSERVWKDHRGFRCLTNTLALYGLTVDRHIAEAAEAAAEKRGRGHG